MEMFQISEKKNTHTSFLKLALAGFCLMASFCPWIALETKVKHSKFLLCWIDRWELLTNRRVHSRICLCKREL